MSSTSAILLSLLSLSSASPLTASRTTPNLLTKRMTFEFLSCPGPLPNGPYPGAPIYMTAAHTNPLTGIVSSLAYLDFASEVEYIIHRESLCSRAGCECLSGAIVCNNFDYAFFSNAIYEFYATDCYQTCSCISQDLNIPHKAILSPDKVINLTVLESPDVVASGRVNVANRLNPKGTAFGFKGCLAGEATGWTLQRLARCCVGYTFEALTPQEAYEMYGVAPYVSASDVIASAFTIGVCLKNVVNTNP